MVVATLQLDEIASRAATMYSRPSVAMEVVRLAEEPRVDAARLRDCVANDPALTCKILRVVNSSLFGLNRPVADLSQAINLLGIQPLKMLVLGFSLPDALFAEVAARELRWYWTNTLTRAVAARLIAEQLWRMPGDEPFVAGLLQDVGILVLLREIGEPYARFLSGVIDEKCSLAVLEQDTLGFDHVQLSASLLKQWQMPERLVQAIELPKRAARLARMESPTGDLPQVLHLAEMLVQVVGQGRLAMLPELLEAGKTYRGMTRSKLASLVEGLQTQVDQLAHVLALELTDDRDYQKTLLEAHQKMAQLSEKLAAQRGVQDAEDEVPARLLAQTNELAGAMQNFLDGNRTRKQAKTPLESRANSAERRPSRLARELASGSSLSAEVSLIGKIEFAAAQCRDRQQELSLLIAQPNVSGTSGVEGVDPKTAQHHTRRALANACEGIDSENLAFVALSGQRTAVVLADGDRTVALSLAKHAIQQYMELAGQHVQSEGKMAATLSVGVATASSLPKNFDPARMIERAVRCLSAARLCGISTVKSIEV